MVKSVCRTFSVFVSVLEGLDQPQGLIHGPPYWEVVHGDLPQDAFVIDDEESSEEEEQNIKVRLVLYVHCRTIKFIEFMFTSQSFYLYLLPSIIT